MIGPFLWAELRREPRLLAGLGVWSVVEAAPAFVIGHAIARAIDDGFAAGRPWTGLGWLAVLAGVWVCAAIGARQVVLALAGIAEPFRERLMARVVESALRRDDGDPAAVARATLQVELARDAFVAVITVVRSFAFTVASVILGMLTLVPEVLVLVLPPFCAGVGLFLLSLPVLARRQRAFLLSDERVVEECGAAVGGLRDIVACGAEERVAAAAGRRVAEQAAAGRALARVTALRTAALTLGGWLPVVGVLAGTPWLLRQGAGPGAILGTLAYITQSLTPALGGFVEGLGVSAVRLTVSLRRLFEQAGPPPRPMEKVALTQEPEVRLDQVTFAYGEHAAPVISGLDLVIPAGDHLAVVGPSGIGKSTLTALITGGLLPREGRVLVGGVPADRLAPQARVLIPQEAYVFRGSLWDNVVYLVPDADETAVRHALAEVGAEELAERLGGLKAPLDPGALSAGERQLVALARAYLSPARLTVLDEATCHLDPASEARAEAAFALAGGTLIVVAHRLSSARRARRILLMDGTRVLLGTHDELVRTSSLYADLAGHWDPAGLEPEPEPAQ